MIAIRVIREFLQRVFGRAPSPEVATVAKSGGVSGPYRPEEFSIFSLARRDRGRIAQLVIEDTCDGDGWEETNLRSVISVELAGRLGEVAETEVGLWKGGR